MKQNPNGARSSTRGAAGRIGAKWATGGHPRRGHKTKPPTAVEYGGLTLFDVKALASRMTPGKPSRVLNRVNESCVRLAVFQGLSAWHAHPTSDEMFFVLQGKLEMILADGHTITVGPNQAVTIPAGTVHRPRAARRTTMLCFKHLVADTAFYDETAGEK